MGFLPVLLSHSAKYNMLVNTLKSQIQIKNIRQNPLYNEVRKF